MPSPTFRCPSPSCGASLKLRLPPPPGAKVRCPHCQTEFVPVPPAPAATKGDVLALAPEEERHCPSCRAPMAAAAVLCIECGFNTRTGEKVKAAKRPSKKKPARSGDDLAEADLPELLDEARTLTELAHKELGRLPHVLGLGDDADFAALRHVSIPGRCANPNCGMSIDGRGLLPTGPRTGTSRVTVTIRFRPLVVELCEDCTQTLLSELEGRDSTARGYLSEARRALDLARRRFPKGAGIEKAREDLRKVELLAAKAPRSRRCFVATAAFGGSFAAEVVALRRFRDEVLERSRPGRWFIRAYGAVSPPLAALIARSDCARALTRALLRPVAAWCARRPGP